MNKIFITAAFAALAFTSCTAQDNSQTDKPLVSPTFGPGRTISQDDFIRTAEQTVNGVVSVKSFATPQMGGQGYGSYSGDPFLEYFFGQPQRRQPQQQEQPRQQQRGSPNGRRTGCGAA